MWATCSPKRLAISGGGDVGVFDGVVQQAGGDGGGVHLHLGEDLADFERMDDVGLAGGALLAFVLLDAELPGAADEVEVVVGAVAVDGVEQLSKRAASGSSSAASFAGSGAVGLSASRATTSAGSGGGTWSAASSSMPAALSGAESTPASSGGNPCGLLELRPAPCGAGVMVAIGHYRLRKLRSG